MQVKFSGNFRELNRFRSKIAAAPNVLKVVSKNLGEEAVELVRDGISRGVDPYGKRHKSLALRNGKPLQDTGRMKIWHVAMANRYRFEIASSADYAGHHQKGTGIYGPRGQPIRAKKAKALRIPVRGGPVLFRRSVKGTPVRMMVPKPGDLPSSWRRRFVGVAQDVLTAHFK